MCDGRGFQNFILTHCNEKGSDIVDSYYTSVYTLPMWGQVSPKSRSSLIVMQRLNELYESDFTSTLNTQQG